MKEAGTEAGKVKILRGVSFPKILDVYSCKKIQITPL